VKNNFGSKMSSSSPAPAPQITTGTSAQVISSPSGVNTTTIAGLTIVSQPQLLVQTQPSLFGGLSSKVSGPITLMDDSQPVDLAAVKKPNLIPGVAPLKIPAVPLRPVPPQRPAVSNLSYRGGPPIPLARPSTIVTVPKPSQVNLAVMQQVPPGGNKMTVLQASPGTQKIITTANIQTQVCI
jgi:hypothetical protein